ncbi:MAG TPA: alginate export family protein [Acidobacteriaceae bacterium]|nr:alginate export family protein [Acidobacteriaceae bacterium]
MKGRGASHWYLLLIAFVVALSSLPAITQTPDPQPPGPPPDPARPPLNPFPAEENWSFLADSAKHTDLFDPLKYIRFGENPQLYLTLGFEYRIEYEYFDNWMFGAGPQDHNGYVMNRAMPHFDFHAGSDFRLFSEFGFDYTDGRNGGPRPEIDEDRGDVHQAFLEIGPHVSSRHGISLRVGRQEVVFGTGRLFDNNEGPNVKLSFDGFRTIAEGAHARLDLFALRPVENNPGWFDDVPNHAQSVWGSYLRVPAPIVCRGRADVYYIGLDTKSLAYNRGSAHELRHTVGARVFRSTGQGLDYNWEPNYQWGSFGNDFIRAWSVSTETGFTFDRLLFHPRPLLRADVYSGDGNPATQPLGTFNPLFPRGAYFTPKAVPFLGPQNLVDLHPVLQFHLKPNVTGAFAWNWYWRESIHDGIYAFGSGVLIDPAGAGHARYLGTQGDLEIRWAPMPHTTVAFNLAGFRPGTFFKTVTYNSAPIEADAGFTYRF